MRLRILKTNVNIDLGSIIHFAYGVACSLLSIQLPGAIIFITKQLLDVYNGEDPPEASGDLAEFSAGLILGELLKLIRQ